MPDPTVPATGRNVTAPASDGAVSASPAGSPPIEVRPMQPADKQALRDGCNRLSDRSSYRRFLTPRHALTHAELCYFTEIDHHDHEALVAIDPATGHCVGVARYVRSLVDPRVADLAVAVADDWQRQGVGTRLTGALADRARHEGISSFTALMLADNQLPLNLIRELGVVHDRHTDLGFVELTIDLPERGVGEVARLLRRTARGDIEAVDHRRPG